MSRRPSAQMIFAGPVRAGEAATTLSPGRGSTLQVHINDLSTTRPGGLRTGQDLGSIERV